MSSKTLLGCIFCSQLISNYSFSSENHFKKLNIKIPINENPYDEAFDKILTSQEIHLDENSILQTHQETNSVYLYCFDCFIRTIDSKDEIMGPFNERQ